MKNNNDVNDLLFAKALLKLLNKIKNVIKFVNATINRLIPSNPILQVIPTLLNPIESKIEIYELVSKLIKCPNVTNKEIKPPIKEKLRIYFVGTTNAINANTKGIIKSSKMLYIY